MVHHLDRNPKEPAVRVAVAIPDYGLVGGAENLVFELTERLARRGRFEFHVLANRWRAGTSRVRFQRISILSFPRWAKPVSFAVFAARWWQHFTPFSRNQITTNSL